MVLLHAVESFRYKSTVEPVRFLLDYSTNKNANTVSLCASAYIAFGPLIVQDKDSTDDSSTQGATMAILILLYINTMSATTTTQGILHGEVLRIRSIERA